MSALLTIYRLLDLELFYNGPHYSITPILPYSNGLQTHMIEKARVRDRWKKLNNWQLLLTEFRDLYNSISVTEEDLIFINESPFGGSVAHLQGLADLHSNHKFTNVIQNFRVAALHWTFLHESTHRDSHALPILPETLSAIVDPNTLKQLKERYEPHTRAKMDAYLRQHRQGELVLPLHLSLMLTPCFLLMLTSLVKSKFPRASINEVRKQFVLSTLF